MKLYTEQQVKQFLKERTFIREDTIDAMCDTLIPIELPSDEEIENDAKKFVLSHNFSLLTNSNHLANTCFQLGAKWMREQILGKEDKTFKQKSKWTNL